MPHGGMSPATRPVLTHRPHTYPNHSSPSSLPLPALSTSASSPSVPPATVIDPSLLAVPPPPFINGGINLAMVAPGQSPQAVERYGQDYFGGAVANAAAGPSAEIKDREPSALLWTGYDTHPSFTAVEDWQQQPAADLDRSSLEPEVPYDLGRKKDGKIARPPNAWILYRSEMLKQLTEGKQVEGLEAALEELNNPPADDESTPPTNGRSRKKPRKPRRPPTKAVNELIRELGSGKGGRGLPQAEISRVISVLWKREGPERRRHYDNLASQAKEEVSSSPRPCRWLAAQVPTGTNVPAPASIHMASR